MVVKGRNEGFSGIFLRGFKEEFGSFEGGEGLRVKFGGFVGFGVLGVNFFSWDFLV